jgi:hypothetical protein
MPQIKEYNQRVEAAGPVQTRRMNGEDFGASTFEALSKVGQSVVGVGDMMAKKQEQDEINDAAVRIAQTHADYTNTLNEQLKNGSIDSQEFMKKYDEHMGEISGNYTTTAGRQFFDKANAQLRSNFLITAVHGQSEVAGDKALVSYTDMQKNLSSGIMNDPSSFEHASAINQAYLDTQVSSGKMDAGVAGKLKSQGDTELAKSAIRGWAQLDPDEAKKQLDSGKWDTHIDGDVKKQLYGEVTIAANAKRIEQERLKTEAEKAKTEGQKITQNDFLSRMEANQLTAKDILNSNLDPVGSGSKKEFLNMLQTNQKEGLKTDPAVYNSLFQKIHLPDGDPNKITDENDLNQYFGKGVNMEALNQLRGEFQGKHTMQGEIETTMEKQLMKTAEAKLTKSNPMLGIKDPDGEENLARFTMYYQQKKQEFRKAGKSISGLLNPDSPDYIGKDLTTFVKTPQEIMQTMTQNMKTQAQPTDPSKARQQGESPADYLKRIKGESK